MRRGRGRRDADRRDRDRPRRRRPAAGPEGIARALVAPVREEVLARGNPEEEVNADIDAAIAEVRAERRAKST